MILKVKAYVIVLMFFMLTVGCQQKTASEPSITWSTIPIGDSIQEDESIEELISPYRQQVEAKMNEVIGYATEDLTSSGEYESNLGTFVTRLSLEQCEAIFDRDIDVSVMNHHGGLRAPINAGDITLGDVFQVMPFENEMVLLEVPGSVLLTLVERINGSGSNMLWPVEFTVGDTGPKDVTLNGKPIIASEMYTMAISDYLANGGGGLNMLIPLKRLEVPVVKLRDIIVKEIMEITARGEKVDERIANHVKLGE